MSDQGLRERLKEAANAASHGGPGRGGWESLRELLLEARLALASTPSQPDVENERDTARMDHLHCARDLAQLRERLQGEIEWLREEAQTGYKARRDLAEEAADHLALVLADSTPSQEAGQEWKCQGCGDVQRFRPGQEIPPCANGHRRWVPCRDGGERGGDAVSSAEHRDAAGSPGLASSPTPSQEERCATCEGTRDEPNECQRYEKPGGGPPGGWIYEPLSTPEARRFPCPSSFHSTPQEQEGADTAKPINTDPLCRGQEGERGSEGSGVHSETDAGQPVQLAPSLTPPEIGVTAQTVSLYPREED